MKLNSILFLLLFFAKAYGQGKAVFYVKDISINNKLPLNFYTNPNIHEPDVVNYSKLSVIEMLTDSTYRVTVTGIDKPLLLLRIGGAINSTEVIVSAGDSLHILISDPPEGSRFKSIIYSGPGSNSYNSSRLTAAYTAKQKDTTIIKDYPQLLKYAHQLQKQRDSLIQTYILPNEKNLLPLTLLKTSQAMLLSDIYSGLSEFNILLQDADVIHFRTLVNAAQINQKEILLSSLYYVNAMRKGMYVLNSYENPEDGFLKKMAVIDSYFKDGIRSFLLANAYYRYSTSKSGDSTSVVIGNNWYRQHKGKLTLSSYNDYIDFTYALVNKVGKPWPKEIANVKIYDRAGKIISFEQLMMKYSGQPTVIDHWATWCSPCISEFTDGKNIVEQLKNKGLKFLYISIDNKSALVKMNELAFKYQLDSYRVADEDVAKYKKYFNLTSIPRYVLINEKGIMANIAMPKPSDESNFRQQLNKYLAPPKIN